MPNSGAFGPGNDAVGPGNDAVGPDDGAVGPDDGAVGPARVSPQDIGRIGEQLARSHLESQGYAVIATNYRCRWGEVDLIARDGPVWAFVEVRTRRSNAYGAPEESVTPAKLERLALAAQDYLAQHTANTAEIQWRIDLIAIRLGPNRSVQSIRHLPNIAAG